MGAERMKKPSVAATHAQGTEEDVTTFLAPTRFVDSDHPSIRDQAQRLTEGETDPIHQAIRIHDWVRDEIPYTPYWDYEDISVFRASTCLAEGRGFCQSKSALMAALARASGIPARLGFADVRNHLASPRLLALIKSDLFIWHGYVEVYLDGRWVKATPVFDRALCEKFGVAPLAFDGRSDSLFQAYDGGRRFMEYVRDRGVHADIPIEDVLKDFHVYYPGLMAEAARLAGQSMHDEAPAGPHT